MPLIFISNLVSVNYEKALLASGFTFTYSDFEHSDGLLLPGGGDISPCLYGEVNQGSENINLKLDIFELYLVQKFLSRDKPILGICRGLQVINVFFGGTLIQNVKGHSGMADVLVPCKFYGEFENYYGKKALVPCRHHQAVKTLGKSLKICGVSSDNVVEAFTFGKVIATQFHPERSDNLAPFKMFYSKF